MLRRPDRFAQTRFGVAPSAGFEPAHTAPEADPQGLSCGARKLCRAWSGCILVFVDKAVASGRSECDDGRWWWLVTGFRWSQVTSERSGAGSMSLLRGICHTVVWPIWCPSPMSSPWMRRYPHVGFSVASRTISRRSPTGVGGRPGRRRGGWVQCRAMRRWCQRSNVSGVTIQPWRSRRGVLRRSRRAESGHHR